jgi:hypothetical protein
MVNYSGITTHFLNRTSKYFILKYNNYEFESQETQFRPFDWFEFVIRYICISRYFIRIEDDFSLNGYFLPFAIVVGVCFAVMLLFMVRLVR